MSIDPLSPYEDEEPSELADWLELTAVLSREHVGRLDLVLDSGAMAEDTQADDIAADDAADERRIGDLTEEIARRRNVLDPEAYPFEMSSNGESLRLKGNLTYGQATYLASLVIAHSWNSGKLLRPAKLTEEEIQAARGHFETLTAVAAVGLSKGPSFLLGTNRAGAAGLLKRIAHVCRIVGEGRARSVPDSAAPPRANDDGVDVLAVEKEADGPPHRNFWFCQSASGANYKEKPISTNEIESFLEIWFEARPAKASGALFFPALLDKLQARYLTRQLGHLCHRLRMPRYAQDGFELIQQDRDLIHYVDDVEAPIRWLTAYLERVEIG